MPAKWQTSEWTALEHCVDERRGCRLRLFSLPRRQSVILGDTWETARCSLTRHKHFLILKQDRAGKARKIRYQFPLTSIPLAGESGTWPFHSTAGRLKPRKVDRDIEDSFSKF